MTGRARLSYHAVPRILPADKQHLQECFYDEDVKQSEGSLSQGADGSEGGKDTTLNNPSYNADLGAGESNDESESETDPYSTVPKPPKINIVNSDTVKQDDNHVMTKTEKGNKCTQAELSEHMQTVVKDMDWEPFQEYLNISRVNLNVRQVLKQGEALGLSPNMIQKCDKGTNKMS